MIYSKGLKRGFDIMVSLILTLIALPVLIVSAVAIKLSSPGPIFFQQKRVGLNGKEFSIIKLRTMVVNESRELKQTHASDPDVFLVGRLLRRLKIDEIPQIFNVLFGDMSLVGPRPSLLETFNEMPEWARKRVSVRPGMTGLAQVNGNVSLSWEERWKYDVKYVENVSLLTDLKLILKTIAVVVMGESRFKVRT